MWIIFRNIALPARAYAITLFISLSPPIYLPPSTSFTLSRAFALCRRRIVFRNNFLYEHFDWNGSHKFTGTKLCSAKKLFPKSKCNATNIFIRISYTPYICTNLLSNEFERNINFISKQLNCILDHFTNTFAFYAPEKVP